MAFFISNTRSSIFIIYFEFLSSRIDMASASLYNKKAILYGRVIADDRCHFPAYRKTKGYLYIVAINAIIINNKTICQYIIDTIYMIYICMYENIYLYNINITI